MVDWDQVERLRSKGWDWARIAADPRVEFTAEAAGGDAGRQLRALYYQRRSRAQRRGGSDADGAARKVGDGEPKPPLLLRIGYLIVPVLGIWAALTYLLPWPGLIVPFLDVLFLFVIAMFVLLFALFQADRRWERALRTPLIIGIAVGLVIPGGLSLAALSMGCPTLKTSAASDYPGSGWARYDNSAWNQNGVPVFFFYGSIACPYCSASSWAMSYALRAFGTLSGTALRISNPNDDPASIPEVDMASAALQSQYVSLQVYEGTNNLSITPLPTLPGCQYSAYYSIYDTTQSIPFVVIGGTWVHSGASLVDPTQLVNATTGQTLTPAQCQAQMNAQSGPCWNAASSAMYWIEAILVKLNGGGPSAVTSNPQVQDILSQLS